MTFGSMSKFKPLKWLTHTVIWIVRGTPLMLQLLVWFFGPYYFFGIQLNQLSFCGIDYRFIAVIIGFSLNYAAYFSEIYRGGIESIPKGQYEAASVLGYNKQQTFFKIILPQSMKAFMPTYTGEVVGLIKATSVVGYITISDLTRVINQLGTRASKPFFSLFLGVVIYLLIGYLIHLIFWLPTRKGGDNQ